MSRCDQSRGIITERSSTATRDVSAVVERTVADYEQEAAGFRQEIDRQRRQSVSSQPQVRSHRRGEEPLPESQNQEAVVVGQEDEEETAQQQQLTGVEEATKSHRPPGELSKEGAEPETTFEPIQEQSRDPHYGSSASDSPGASKSSSSRRIITERSSSATREVSVALERTVADYEEEAEGFRQEIDRQRRQSELQDQTPERLPDSQSQEVVVVVCEEEGQQLTGVGGPETHCSPSNEEDDAADDGDGDGEQPATAPRVKQEDSTDPDYEMPSRSGQHKKKPGRPRMGTSRNHLTLRIRISEDSQTKVLSKAVFQKSSVSDSECPRGSQEVDFSDSSRSTFPQSAAGQPFEIFVGARNRQSQPSSVKTVTPEEIRSNHRSSGKPTLYIRSKETEEPPSANPEVTKGDGATLHTRPIESVDEAEMGENDAADDNWNPDSELPPTKKRRKRKEKKEPKRTGESKSSCKVCGAWYRQSGSSISHVWSHAGDPQGVCGACGEKFQSADESKEHLGNHQNVHGCQHCGKTFVSAQSLNLHVAKHKGESQFKCNVCGKAFTNMASSSYHQWNHVDEKPHKCDVCFKTFGLESHLVSHKKSHDSTEKHVCDVCGRSFRSRRAMLQHRLTHYEDKQYACGICGKRFKSEGSSKVHSKTHTERDRKFLCHVCCRTFLWKTTSMAHLKTHSNVRPFDCAVCGKCFWFRCDSKKHMRVHSDEAPFECSECGRRFKQKANSDSHVKIHSGIKMFVCGVCGKECSRREHSKIHMRTHSGDKPYKCTVCDRAFTQSHCSKTHMKTHQREEIPDSDPSQSSQRGENPEMDPSQSFKTEANSDSNLSET